MVGKDECICHGNWRTIIKECEPLIDKLYLDDNGAAHRFIGVMHGIDDYYYCMLSMAGQLQLLSCAGSIDGFGYTITDTTPQEG